MLEANAIYNVVCLDCGQVFTPVVNSPLWWRAKKRDEEGHADALCIVGTECGCVEQPHRPDAPFRVFGYDDLCADFDIPLEISTEAMRMFLYLSREGCNVVFISGVSDAIKDKLLALASC